MMLFLRAIPVVVGVSFELISFVTLIRYTFWAEGIRVHCKKRWTKFDFDECNCRK